MAKNKAYVVWDGYEPGIYDTWAECEEQIKGYSGAKFKGFPSEKLAKEAFMNGPEEQKTKEQKMVRSQSQEGIVYDSICVDGACSGNPGQGAYQCVDVKTGEQLFIETDFEETTNNVMEFLALWKGIKYLYDNNIDRPIYSDSISAMAWVRDKKCRSSIKQTDKNFDSIAMIRKAENWLSSTKYNVTILKWDTKNWGEIPADFGNK